MRPHELIDVEAQLLRGHYAGLLAGAKGAWEVMIESLPQGPHLSNGAFRGALGASAGVYLPLMSSHVYEAVGKAHRRGRADGGAPDTAGSAGYDHIAQHAQQALRAAVARDVANVTNHAHRAALRYEMSRAHGAAFARAAARQELPHQMRDVFVQLDRAGRNHQSVGFAALGLRASMVSAYAAAFLDAVVGQGVSFVQAVHPHEPAETIQVRDLGGWIDEHMHPNTRWSFQLKEAV